MKIRFCLILLINLFVIGAFSQSKGCLLLQKIDCWQKKTHSLNYDDPEILSLHNIFIEDILKEIYVEKEKFGKEISCDTATDYYHLLHKFNKLIYDVELKHDTFQVKKSNIGTVFYNLALEDISYFDTNRALYHLDRALQYEPNHPESLLESAKIALSQNRFSESVDFVHKVYIQEHLLEEVEKKVSDFTLLLYERLYSHGNELVQAGRSAEALEVFYVLEHFCSNMPTGYCNDDYYKGLMLSREGVYDSYISIAKEAERRGNKEMAAKFYQYAEEYLKKMNE